MKKCLHIPAIPSVLLGGKDAGDGCTVTLPDVGLRRESARDG
jgi:hypothetical protein